MKKTVGMTLILAMGFVASACGDEEELTDAERFNRECYAFCQHAEECNGDDVVECTHNCSEIYHALLFDSASPEVVVCAGAIQELAHCVANEECSSATDESSTVCAAELEAVGNVCD